MVREIRIYIEGSGDESEDESTTENIPPTRPGFRSRIPAGKETTAGLRAGFVHLFKELYDFAESKGIKILSIMSGSRRDACDDFLMSVESYPESFNVLLVDSESPVSESHTPWEHLRSRKEDQPWILDSLGIDDACCHLMVQTMEAWFIADIDALNKFYNGGFKADYLREKLENQSVEKVLKYNLTKWLKSATDETSKGKYHKTRHAPKLLALLDIDKVRKASPSCDRLFITLTKIIEMT
ncbi:DUF4276 family protein [Microcoleus sp. CAWBG640]|uniref:DUF4276 family protein n=1 Tax=Microcoleus sp. CAWBG640 TaxID=2841653 RepID=UPI00312B35CD